MAREEYEVQGCYGYGYEKLVTVESRAEAESLLKDYNENEQDIPHRIVVKKEAEDGDSSRHQDGR